jgi:tetratricopeptide (TPR) repeat protein
MNLIRLYHSSTDVQPKALLHHFLRYIGFYVEEITKGDAKSEEESIADIYIIGRPYVEENGYNMKLDREECTIIIRTDKLDVQSDRLLKQIFSEKMPWEEFLRGIVDLIAETMRRQSRQGDFLARDVEEWTVYAQRLVGAYLECRLLQSAIYARCFYRQDILYERARKNYQRFIDAMSSQTGAWKSTRMERYAELYAQYELDIIAWRNGQDYPYDPQQMLDSCTGLLHEGDKNEQLLILHANIQYDLLDNWSEASDEYQNTMLRHCIFPKYQFGRIARIKLKDYENALSAFKYATQQKKDYFNAWYQMGLCHEGLGKYREAIEDYEKVMLLLKRRLERHILSPMELEYLYKACMKVSLIYTNRLGDMLASESYGNRVSMLRKEIERTEFLYQIWPEARDDEILREAVITAINEHMNETLL